MDPFGHLEHADGADQIGHLRGAPLHMQHELGNRRRGIAAPGHGRGAGMAGHADRLADMAHAAVDRGHDAERQAELVEHGPCSMWTSTKPR